MDLCKSVGCQFLELHGGFDSLSKYQTGTTSHLCNSAPGIPWYSCTTVGLLRSDCLSSISRHCTPQYNLAKASLHKFSSVVWDIRTARPGAGMDVAVTRMQSHAASSRAPAFCQGSPADVATPGETKNIILYRMTIYNRPTCFITDVTEIFRHRNQPTSIQVAA